MSVTSGLDRSQEKWVDGVARAGHVARGVVYILVGLIVLRLAFGEKEESVDSRGAISDLADRSFGTVMLVLLCIGLVCWTATLALGALRGRGGKKAGESDASARAADAGRAVINAFLTVAAISVLAGSGSGSESGGGGGSGGSGEKEKQATARLLELPFGKALVVLVGLGIIGFGAWLGWRGLKRKFTKGLDFSRLPAAWPDRTEVLGVAGHLARAVVAAAIGIFLIKAALDYDPSDAVGIDGALSRLARASYGPVVLGAVALGLVAFGLWSFVEAWLRRPES